MGFVYVGIGVVLLLWGGSQLRHGLKPFRLRPYLLVTLGVIMIYNGFRFEQLIP